MTPTQWLLPIGVAVGVGVALLGRQSSWRRTAGWLGLGLAGYAAALQLIDAGPFVRYQHYAPLGTWLTRAPVASLILVFELVVVATGLWRHRGRIRQTLARWPTAGLVLAAGLVAATSAAPSANVATFATELVVATALQCLHLGAVLLAGLSLPTAAAERFDGSTRRWLTGGDGARVDRSIAAIAVFAGVVPLLLGWLSYQWHPHVPDEVVYLIHARYFANGMLSLPLPDPASAFDLDLMFASEGRWFSPVPLGWPAMLAVGARVGLPWLINPILNAINVVLVAALVRRVYDGRTALVAALLYAVSPWNLFLAMSLLTHTFTLTAGLGAAVAVARFRAGDRVAWMAWAGIGIGVVSLIRPLEGMILAVALGCWSLTVRPWRRLLPGLAAIVAVTGMVASLTLPYNAALTGSARVFPIMAYADHLYGPGSNAMGFGPNRGLGWSGLDPFPGHGWRDAILNSHLNLGAINVEMLGWGTGSLALVGLFVFSRRFRPGDLAMLLVIVATIGAHLFYWFAGGPDFGARYWYLAAPAALILTARGLLQTVDTSPTAASRGRVALGFAALMIGTLAVFVPWRATDKYYHYRGMRPDLNRLLPREAMKGGLILVRGKRHPDYASAAVLNHWPARPGAPLVAWNRDRPTRDETIRRYRDRTVWFVDGPSLTNDNYRLTAGPLTADSALSMP